MRFGKIRMRQAALCLALAANLGGSKIPPLDLPGNQLRSITTLTSGHQVVVTFHTEGDYRFEKFELENPKRLVIDLIRLRNAVRPNIIRINSGSLNQINVTQIRNQNPPITRVTMNLGTSNPAYTVARQGTRVQVVIGAAGAKASSAAPAPTVKAKEAAAEIKPEAAASAKETAPAPAPKSPPALSPSAAGAEVNAAAADTKTTLAEAKSATPEPVPITKLPSVDNSAPDFFRARTVKLNPKQIRVRPYLERPFGTTAAETAPAVNPPAAAETAMSPAVPAAAPAAAFEPPVIEETAPTTQAVLLAITAAEPTTLPEMRVAPVDALKNATTTEALKPAEAGVAAALPSTAAPALSASAISSAAKPSSKKLLPAAKNGTKATVPAVTPAKTLAPVSGTPSKKAGSSSSTRVQVSPARPSWRPIRITTIDPTGTAGVSRTLNPQEVPLDLPQANHNLAAAATAPAQIAPAPTQSIQNPPLAAPHPAATTLNREAVPVQAETSPLSRIEQIDLPPPAPKEPASAEPVVAPPAPAPMLPAGSPAVSPSPAPSIVAEAPAPVSSAIIAATESAGMESTTVIPPVSAAPAPTSGEPAAVGPKKPVPIQMSPEEALNIALATPGGAGSGKLPAAKGLKRLPPSKPAARPSAPASAIPKIEPVALPQQLAALRLEPRKTATVPQQARIEPSETGQYSGEAIDLKVKDLDLADFFRMMSEISGLNISVDPDVSGKITMNMGAVPWDQIFDLALVTHRLDKKIEGNVVRVARKETLQAEATAKKTMKQAVEDAQDTQFMSFRLNYADAKGLSESLKEHLSSRGQVIFDERTNTIIVSDLPKKLLDVSQLVKTLDVSEPQVIIESRIVQATRNFAREIGVNLGFVAGNGERVTVGAPPLGAVQIPGLLNPNVNLAASRQNGVLGIKVGNIFDTFLLDAAISAGEQKGIAKLLSEPKVTAQNNREATIRQGVRFPVQVVQNNTVSVIFQDASLTLKVTPKITDAGTVLLNLRVENNVADFTRSVNGIPSISTSESETRVLVPNGGTTVIGGILVDEDRNTDDKVPGMASVPIFGHLFKKRSTEKRTQEVLFFVTPRIDH